MQTIALSQTPVIRGPKVANQQQYASTQMIMRPRPMQKFSSKASLPTSYSGILTSKFHLGHSSGLPPQPFFKFSAPSFKIDLNHYKRGPLTISGLSGGQNPWKKPQNFQNQNYLKQHQNPNFIENPVTRLKNDYRFISQQIEAQMMDLKRNDKNYLKSVEKIEKKINKKEISKISFEDINKAEDFYDQLKMMIEQKREFSSLLEECIKKQNTQEKEQDLEVFTQNMIDNSINQLKKHVNFFEIYPKLVIEAEAKVRAIAPKNMKLKDEGVLRQVYIYQEIQKYLEKFEQKKDRARFRKDYVIENGILCEVNKVDSSADLEECELDQKQTNDLIPPNNHFVSFQDYLSHNNLIFESSQAYDLKKNELLQKIHQFLQSAYIQQDLSLTFEGKVIENLPSRWQIFECLSIEQLDYFFNHKVFDKAKNRELNDMLELQLSEEQNAYINSILKKPVESMEFMKSYQLNNDILPHIQKIYQEYEIQAEIIMKENFLIQYYNEIIDMNEMRPQEIDMVTLIELQYYTMPLQMTLKEYYSKKRIVNIYRKMKWMKEKHIINAETPIEITLKNALVQHSRYFKNFLHQQENLRDYVNSLEMLTEDQKDYIFVLHNKANTEEIYGESLFMYLLALQEKDDFDSSHSEKIYVLSVDWPKNVVI